MGSLTSLNKDELQGLADERGVEGVDQDSQTKDEMIAALEASGVTSEGEAGASASARTSTLPGVGPVEIPDLDEATRRHIDPLPAVPRNPGLDYDDSLRG
jgi:hypothetical protein